MNTITKNDKTRQLRNLRPLREHARKASTKSITIHRTNDGGAEFTSEWVDGASATVQFASFQVCKDFAINPRRVWHNDNLTLSIH